MLMRTPDPAAMDTEPVLKSPSPTQWVMIVGGGVFAGYGLVAFLAWKFLLE